MSTLGVVLDCDGLVGVEWTNASIDIELPDCLVSLLPMIHEAFLYCAGGQQASCAKTQLLTHRLELGFASPSCHSFAKSASRPLYSFCRVLPRKILHMCRHIWSILRYIVKLDEHRRQKVNILSMGTLTLASRSVISVSYSCSAPSVLRGG